MKESITLTAATKYREALGHWNHPNIHFNLAIATVSLDQPVETYEHLQQAIQYGPKPLEEERFQHAKNYLFLLEKQIVHLRLHCAAPGGVVELDGAQLFQTPGEWKGLVRAGRHTIVARREGYITNTSVRELAGEQSANVELDLKTLAQLTIHDRRWAAWKPWAVLGAGAALAAGGAVAQSTGKSDIREVDRKSKLQCPTGCPPPGEPANLRDLRNQGKLLQGAGIAGYAVGGAAMLLGGVMVWLNRDHVTVRGYDNRITTEPVRQAQLELSPYVAPGAPGLSLRVRF